QVGDRGLLLAPDLNLLEVRRLLGELAGQRGSPVVTVKQPVGLERADVAADRDLRRLDGLRQLAQREGAVRAEEFENAFAAVGGEDRLATVRRAWDVAHGPP